LVSIRGFSCMA